MKGVLKRVGFRLNTRLGSKIGFVTKSLPTFPKPTKIGCLTLSPKRVEV